MNAPVCVRVCACVCVCVCVCVRVCGRATVGGAAPVVTSLPRCWRLGTSGEMAASET